uniref:Uncharacterized protein n=1 Tax=Glossina pallidipes TaxID=7398 RepID=A0A1A9ZJ97_GLOPL
MKKAFLIILFDLKKTFMSENYGIINDLTSCQVKKKNENEQNIEKRNHVVLLYLDSVMTTSKFYPEYQTAKFEDYLNRCMRLFTICKTSKIDSCVAPLVMTAKANKQEVIKSKGLLITRMLRKRIQAIWKRLGLSYSSVYSVRIRCDEFPRSVDFGFKILLCSALRFVTLQTRACIRHELLHTRARRLNLAHIVTFSEKRIIQQIQNIPRIERAASTIARQPHDLNVYFKNYVHTTQNMMPIQQIDTSYNIINNLVFSSSPSVQHGMKDYVHEHSWQC